MLSKTESFQSAKQVPTGSPSLGPPARGARDAQPHWRWGQEQRRQEGHPVRWHVVAPAGTGVQEQLWKDDSLLKTMEKVRRVRDYLCCY